MKYLPYIYFGFLLLMSLITLCAFAKDKKNSSREGRGRTPEIVLLTLCGLGGAVGALIGMYVLRHKTDPVTKFHFFVTVWLSAILQAGLAVLAVMQLV